MVTCGNMCSFWLISSKWAGNMLVTCQFTYSRHVTTTFDLKIVKINALLTHITVWYQPCNYYKTYVVTCGYFDNCLVKVVVTCLKYVNWYVNNMLPDYLLEISQNFALRTDWHLDRLTQGPWLTRANSLEPNRKAGVQ